MMNIQDRILKNAEYFRGIEMAGIYPILRVTFPEKWGVLPSDDGRIKIARSEDTANEWYYYTTENNVTLDDMFDLMEATAKMNLSAIAKIELLKIKVAELKEVFGRESLETLQTLQFTFEKPKVKKTTRKKAQKKETKEEVNETVECNSEIISNKEEERSVAR